VFASKEIRLGIYANKTHKTQYMVMYRDQDAGRIEIIKTEISSFGIE
jgi:hypothetical protein